MKAKEIEDKMWDNKDTETLLRKWIRKYLVSLTDSQKQKCIFHINKYGGNIDNIRV